MFFLECLVDGVVNLYYMCEGMNETYFIEDDERMYELSNETRIVEVGLKKYEKKSNQYKAGLTLAFQNNPELRQRIQTAPFKYDALVNLTKDYHDLVCDGEACIDYTKQVVNSHWIEPYASIGYSMMKIHHSKDATTAMEYGLGMLFRSTHRKLSPSWNVALGLAVHAAAFEGDFDTPDLFNYKGRNRIELQQIIVKVPMLLSYQFSQEKLTSSLHFGYVNNFIVASKTDMELVKLDAFTGEETAAVYDSESRVPVYNFGLTLGYGLNYKWTDKGSWHAALNYEFRTSRIDKNNADLFEYSYFHTLSLMVGYIHAF